MQTKSVWKILLVDDDEDDYFLTKQMLDGMRGKRPELEWASTFEAGRQALTTDNYDAVLMDYDLGPHTGLDLIREAVTSGYPAPIILLTGRGSYEVDLEAMQAGATLYLTKNEVNPLLLERSIRYAIERKQAEENLRLSEERFSKAFDATPNALVVSRMADGRIELINDSFERLFGYSRAEVIGKTSLQLNMIADPAQRDEMVRRMRSDPSLRNFETDIRLRSGEIRPAKLSIEMLTIDREIYILTIIEDITAQKQAERDLRESEAKFRFIAAHLKDILFFQDLDLRYTWIYNPADPLEDSQVIGKTDADLLPPEEAGRLTQIKRQVLQTGTGTTVELQLSPGGIARWYEAVYEPARDSAGQIIGVLSYSRDITRRKEVEQALRESESHFRQLADAMPQLVWTARPDGVVDYYNSRYREYDGIAPGEGEIWGWGPVLHPDDLEPTVRAWQHSIQTGEIYQIEHRVRMADGAYRWHLSRGVPQRDELGRVSRWYGTATDIHAQKQAEDQLRVYAAGLERSNQELNEFAFVASHDLQEPLRKIEQFSEHLQTRLNDSLTEAEKDIFSRLQNAARRMRKMVDALLILARVTSQAQPFTPVDLQEIAAEVVSDLEIRIQQTGGEVRIGELPTIDADPLQMRQLLQNLIVNALKFHQPGVAPQVRVSAGAVAPNQVEISVADNGIGFDMESLEKIFQPFRRLHGVSEYEGVGIGLSTCRKIVERHGGSITAASTPGAGSRFTVVLPVRQPAA